MTPENTNDSRKALSVSEIRELISSIKEMRDQLILRILYETGCTPRELVNIKVSDLAGNQIMIKESESTKLRFPKISGRLAKDISDYAKGNKLEKNSYLLSTRQSGRISEKRIRQIIQSGTKKNPMMFRYYHIAHAYQEGVFIEEISKQLGLTNFRIFQIINEIGIKPKEQLYNKFLSRVG